MTENAAPLLQLQLKALLERQWCVQAWICTRPPVEKRPSTCQDVRQENPSRISTRELALHHLQDVTAQLVVITSCKTVLAQRLCIPEDISRMWKMGSMTTEWRTAFAENITIIIIIRGLLAWLRASGPGALSQFCATTSDRTQVGSHVNGRSRSHVATARPEHGVERLPWLETDLRQDVGERAGPTVRVRPVLSKT